MNFAWKWWILHEKWWILHEKWWTLHLKWWIKQHAYQSSSGQTERFCWQARQHWTVQPSWLPCWRELKWWIVYSKRGIVYSKRWTLQVNQPKVLPATAQGVRSAVLRRPGEVRVDAVCFAFTCLRLIGLSRKYSVIHAFAWQISLSDCRYRGGNQIWEAKGATHKEELNTILTHPLGPMIRRLGADVLTQLPEKRRTKVDMKLEPGDLVRSLKKRWFFLLKNDDFFIENWWFVCQNRRNTSDWWPGIGRWRATRPATTALPPTERLRRKRTATCCGWQRKWVKTLDDGFCIQNDGFSNKQRCILY